MSIPRVGASRVLQAPEEQPQRINQRSQMNSIRDEALNNEPNRSQRRSRKVTNYQDENDFGSLLEMLNHQVKTPNFKKAYVTAGEIYGIYLAQQLDAQESTELFKAFKTIISTGFENNTAKARKYTHKEFYAFLKGALARHYHLVNKNPEKVERTYREAIKLGDECSWYYLGEYFDQQDRGADAVEQFIACTEKYPDKPFAFRELGKYYQMGWADVPANLPMANINYTIARKNGCVESAFNLALLFENMPVVNDRDRQVVIDAYKTAMQMGSPDGAHIPHIHDLPVEKTAENAVHAANAAHNLGVIYQKGWTRTTQTGEKIFDQAYINLQEAEACFRMALGIKNDPDSYLALAEIVTSNSNIRSQDRIEAIQDMAQELRLEGSLRVLELDAMLESSQQAAADEPDFSDLLSFASTAAQKSPLVNPPLNESNRLRKELELDPTNMDLYWDAALAE